jgi:hypothetical protein
LNTSEECYTKAVAAGTLKGMSESDTRFERPPKELQPVSAIRDDDVPARRLLAHDMEHLIWDDDGDEAAPPPD